MDGVRKVFGHQENVTDSRMCSSGGETQGLMLVLVPRRTTINNAVDAVTGVILLGVHAICASAKQPYDRTEDGEPRLNDRSAMIGRPV